MFGMFHKMVPLVGLTPMYASSHLSLTAAANSTSSFRNSMYIDFVLHPPMKNDENQDDRVVAGNNSNTLYPQSVAQGGLEGHNCLCVTAKTSTTTTSNATTTTTRTTTYFELIVAGAPPTALFLIFHQYNLE